MREPHGARVTTSLSPWLSRAYARRRGETRGYEVPGALITSETAFVSDRETDRLTKIPSRCESGPRIFFGGGGVQVKIACFGDLLRAIGFRVIKATREMESILPVSPFGIIGALRHRYAGAHPRSVRGPRILRAPRIVFGIIRR